MMARRTVGYLELEWTCPNCSTRNRGRDKTCSNCGAPQPENVQFERPAEAGLVQDGGLRTAAAGADIHCPFCGTRNPGNATVCSQCGGDLVEGRRRAAGRELAPAPPTPKVLTCTNCGTENPPSNQMCSKCGAPLPRPAAAARPAPVAAAVIAQATPKKANTKLLVGIGAALLLACAAAAALFFVPTSSVPATVSDVYWQTSVPVQEMQSVSYSNERGSPPSDAYDVACRTESQEVCEQKTIDRGNGFAEVVEDCHTETDQYCSYRRDEWRTIQTYTEDGHDFSPFFAQPGISTEQRLGEEAVNYTVTFATEDGTKDYSPSDFTDFAQFEIGSTWTLQLNALGSIMSVSR